MKTDYGVRVLTAYDTRRVGQVIFPPALLRDRLVQLGCVERILPADLAPQSPSPVGVLVAEVLLERKPRRGRPPKPKN